MYGYQSLSDIVREVPKTHADAIDVWPKVHGNQREQMDELGFEEVERLLKEQKVSLGCITQYKLGPFGLDKEFDVAARFGCSTIVTGAKGPKGLSGAELRDEVYLFVKKMRPHLQKAQRLGIDVAIENHANNLIESADGIKWLAEASEGLPMKIALAPYHLPQDAKQLADLVTQLDDRLGVFYAWQHGNGCMEKMPKKAELLQMPGRGPLDFGPLLAALRKINFAGWTSIFMHPFPRGIPILPTTDEVTAEINRSREYLQRQLGEA
jgi:sugar phosphate isomerase/epimerase